MNRKDVDFDRFSAATDESRMLELFAERLPEKYAGQGGRISVDRLWIPRVVPLKSGEFAIQFRLSISGDSTNNDLILWGKLARSEGPYSDRAESQHLLEYKELGLVVSLFPFDEKLPLLQKLWNSGRRQPVKIAAVTESDQELWFTARQVLGYRLEKRCTLRGELCIKSAGGGVDAIDVALKLMRPRRAARLIENYKFLERSGLKYDASDGITIPKLVFTDEMAGIIISETVTYPSLHDLTDPKRFIPACARAGSALRRLHSLDPADLPAFTLTDELSGLRRNCDLIERTNPDLTRRIAMTIETLNANMPQIDSSGFVVSHRDFFDKQILISDKRVTLLDFDTLSLADPALDLGNFLAHLFLRGLQNSELQGLTGKGSDAFTGAYTSGGNDLTGRVRWWHAAALVRLAGLYSLRPRWRRIAPALLDQAVMEMDNVVQ